MNVSDLKMIDAVELSGESWGFDLVGAWIDPTGGILLGTDSGGSCPIPWENHLEIDSFTGPLTVEQAQEEATSLWECSYERYDEDGFKIFLKTIEDATCETKGENK